MLTAVLVATNLVGSAAVVAVIYLVLPLPQVSDSARVELVNGLVERSRVELRGRSEPVVVYAPRRRRARRPAEAPTTG